ncbi:MAG: ABC transporter permease [Thermomicrobiales bacterium]|nr:ABC transporter permease [Thermomicrobiales bacterium]
MRATDWKRYVRRWEFLLFVCLIVVVVYNSLKVSNFLTAQNQANLLQLSIEKAIVALIMTFVIISGEIDLSVASMMGLAAAVMATLYESGWNMALAIVAALLVGLVLGAINGFFVAKIGINSLAVTLAGFIGFRGLATTLVEDKSIGAFPDWLTRIGQRGLIGPMTFSILLFFLMAAVAIVILHFSGFGRQVYAIGSNARVALFSGVPVARTRIMIFAASGMVSALAGVLYAARLGAVRSSTAQGYELDIITIVLLGGVSIFGGIGTMVGVLLSILLVLNIRNGMTIAGITGNTQTGVVGLLLILSVLIPNLASRAQGRFRRSPVDTQFQSPRVEVSAPDAG